MGKSITPVSYGFPYIDLTKQDQNNQQYEDDNVVCRNLSYANQLKNQLHEFMSTKKPNPTINVFDDEQ
jgi:hypothetical protein